MAGTPIGKIDCAITNASANLANQEVFKNTFDFFEQMVTAGYATRIALQYGASGTGTDYHDGTNPFGENAFAVYRMDGSTSGNSSSARDGSTLPDFDYYVLIQWADTAAFGTTPGNPGTLDAGTGDGVGIVVAVREDGGSPWNGGTANAGADAKGSTVWTAGASVLHVFPISNSFTGGSHLTNKENARLLVDSGTGGVRMSWVGTADSFAFIFDAGDTGTYQAHYVGIYEPRSGLSPSLPLVCASPSAAATLPWPDGTATTWGTTTGDGTNEGGVLGTLLTDLMTTLSVGQDVAGVFTAVSQPNNQLATPELDAFPIRLVQRGTGRVGYLGDLEPGLIQVVYDVATNQTNAAQSRAYFGSATQASLHLAVAWGGSNTPGTNSTRAGVTF
jgi:hypothetical protein